MSRAHDRRESSGWNLQLDLPSYTKQDTEELVSQILGAVDSSTTPPLRTSRRARTYRVRFRSSLGTEFDLFAKCFDPPNAAARLTRIGSIPAPNRISRVTARLIEAGICAPPIWLRGIHQASRRELMVCPRAAGKGPLRTLASLGSLREKRDLLRELGRAVAGLHRAGFVHGDLTPFNIFVLTGVAPRFTFLDHERTHRRSWLPMTRPLLRNLVQLGRFGLPGISAGDRMRVLDGYLELMNFRNRRKMIRRVSMMLRRRLARDGGFERIAPPATPPPEEGVDERGGQDFRHHTGV